MWPQPLKKGFVVPGAASGCLTCLLVQLLVTGIKQRCGGCLAVCDLLGRCGGGFGGSDVSRGSSACGCFGRRSAVKGFCPPSCQGLQARLLNQGVLWSAHPVTYVAWLETLYELIWASLMASSTYGWRRCELWECLGLFGCYWKSSSVLLWVGSAWALQLNKIIIVWVMVYTSLSFRNVHVTPFRDTLFSRRHYYNTCI